MKKSLLEITKGASLILFVIIGVIIFDKNSIEVKARKIQEEGGSLSKVLSRKERNEYMEYLRELNDFDYRRPIYKKQI